MIPVWSEPDVTAPPGLFSWGGFTISSNLRLPRLLPVGGNPDWAFRWMGQEPVRLPPPRLRGSVKTRAGGRLDVWVGGDDHLLVYGVAGVGIFSLIPDESTIRFYPEPHADPMLVEHSLVNSMLPILAGMKGEVCLHAASVAREGQALVLAGPSGVGKSTLAWKLMQEGWQFLADDATVIRKSNRAWMAFLGPLTLRAQGLAAPDSWMIRGKTEMFPGRVSNVAGLGSIALLFDGNSSRREISSAMIYRSLLGLQSGWRWAATPARVRLSGSTWDLVEKTEIQEA